MREGRVAAGLVAGALATLGWALVLARRVRVREAREAPPVRAAIDERALQGRSGQDERGGS